MLKPTVAPVPISGVIFDLDGTLLDSMPLWRNVGQRFLEQRNYVAAPTLSEELKTLSLAQAADYLIDHYHLPLTRDTVTAEVNQLIEGYYQHLIPLRAGARELLERLQQAAIPLCIATATDRYQVQWACDRLGISQYFSAIFTCGEIGIAKDEPAIYLQAAAHLGTEIAATLVVEDALYAAKTAHQAGFIVAGIYDESSAADWDALRDVTDLALENLNDLQFIKC